jgi:hypothetical protein
MSRYTKSNLNSASALGHITVATICGALAYAGALGMFTGIAIFIGWTYYTNR